MANRKKRQEGISPAGKAAILCVIFGIPLLFVLSSWGLSQLYDAVPYAIVLVLLVLCTVYSARIARLMYTYYEVDAPVIRFVPVIGEVCLLDIKYHLPCYIGYAISVLFLVLSLLPYDVLKIFGTGFATNASFYLMLVAIVVALAVQIIIGVGLMHTMKDIAEDWKKQVHADVGAISKFSFFGFIPFVRVIALYALDKPLSTMVDFMGVTSEDAEEDDGFIEEEE